MADQHNANIPAVGNTIAADIPDIKENLEFHKDVFENFVGTWSNTVATGIYPTKFKELGSGGSILQVTIFNIGDWNMDSTASVSIAHSLTRSKIRGIFVSIQDDAETLVIPIPFTSSSGDTFYADGTNVVISRASDGQFDNTNYNATSFNRGWITIIHTT